jgi:hypothetical protein
LNARSATQPRWIGGGADGATHDLNQRPAAGASAPERAYAISEVTVSRWTAAKPIAAALVVMTMVAACGSSSGGSASPAGAMDYEDLTVGFIQTGSEGGWRAANTASFKDEAEALGLNLKFYDAQNKL